MKVTSSAVAEYGHCEAILARGPFQIGKDFAAPSPAFGVVRHVHLECSRIKWLMSKVEPACPPGRIVRTHSFSMAIGMPELTLRNGVQKALRCYEYELRLPTTEVIREQIAAFRASIIGFQSQLPKETDILGQYLHQAYTGEMFQRDDLRPDAADLAKLQANWEHHVGLGRIGQSLNVMLRYLAAAEKCLGKGRRHVHPVKSLVRALAQVWKDLTGSWPTSGRKGKPVRQTGEFAGFVRAVVRLLPRELRPYSVDGAIRQACENPQ